MKNSQLVFWFLLSLLMGTILSLGIGTLVLANNNGTAAVYLAQEISQIGMFLVPALVLALLRREARGMLGLDFSKSKRTKSLMSIVALVLLIPFLTWITQWNEGWHLPHFQSLESFLREKGELSATMVEQLIFQPGEGRLILNLFVMAITPAVCEELFFRCGIQGMLVRCTGKSWLSILIAAVVFSLAHGEFFAFVPRVVLGCILGALFYKTGSILVNVAFHFANNALVVIASYMAANGWCDAGFVHDEYRFPLLVVLLSFVLGVGLVYYICSKGDNKLLKKDRQVDDA